MSGISAEIRVTGIVQGVGFRPFIHRLVARHSLCGTVCNSSDGARLELEGEEAEIDAFLKELPSEKPPLAYIEKIECRKSTELKHFRDFRIIESLTLKKRQTLLSPDVSVCDDCRRELFDPQDRRYRYPFLNCTNCGPRFTIIRDIPYDRPGTTMAPFSMCPDCASEYHTITDRRYHAQPVCCPACGPELFFYDKEGKLVSRSGPEGYREEPLQAARRLLLEGGILAVKGLGGIHLAARADSPSLAALLRQRKRRGARPLALMCRSTEAARTFCHVSAEEETELCSFRRPIVLLKKKDPASYSYLSENACLGIMLPYTPLHELLLEAPGPDTLIMTSANASELPMLIRNEEALEHLSGIADGFLLNDRDIHVRCDDSLLWVFEGKPYPVRRSRGYVPFPVALSGSGPMLLACGAEQKASFCLSRKQYAFPSQHMGDLKNLETLEHYSEQVEHFKKLYDIEPQGIICDAHPDYLSTRYAEETARRRGLPLLRVQHHHAHLVSCLADNAAQGPAIGIIWDGTGWGSDGTVWGGEFLLGDASGFERVGSIRPLLLPGGDKAARELWRAGISLLLDAGEDPAEFFPQEQCRQVEAQLQLGLNVPVTTGMGRLFDAVSSVLDVCREASYEGRGAILLESRASASGKVYPYRLLRDADASLLRGTAPSSRYIIDERPAVRAMCGDLRRGVSAADCSAAFHNMLIAAAAELCARLSAEHPSLPAALSGGCFQNMRLLSGLSEKLRQEGIPVLHHSRVSANDEGISLGQLEIGRKQLSRLS